MLNSFLHSLSDASHPDTQSRLRAVTLLGVLSEKIEHKTKAMHVFRFLLDPSQVIRRQMLKITLEASVLDFATTGTLTAALYAALGAHGLGLHVVSMTDSQIGAALAEEVSLLSAMQASEGGAAGALVGAQSTSSSEIKWLTAITSQHESEIRASAEHRHRMFSLPLEEGDPRNAAYFRSPEWLTWLKYYFGANPRDSLAPTLRGGAPLSRAGSAKEKKEETGVLYTFTDAQRQRVVCEILARRAMRLPRQAFDDVVRALAKAQSRAADELVLELIAPMHTLDSSFQFPHNRNASAATRVKGFDARGRLHNLAILMSALRIATHQIRQLEHIRKAGTVLIAMARDTREQVRVCVCVNTPCEFVFICCTPLTLSHLLSLSCAYFLTHTNRSSTCARSCLTC
jgi:hypothetical protein